MTAEYVTILFLLAFTAFREILAWRREKDLLDRLAARDLPELVTYQTERRRAEIPNKIIQERGVAL